MFRYIQACYTQDESTTGLWLCHPCDTLDVARGHGLVAIMFKRFKIPM